MWILAQRDPMMCDVISYGTNLSSLLEITRTDVEY